MKSHPPVLFLSVALGNLSRCQQQPAAWSVQELDSFWEAPQSCLQLLLGGSLVFPGEPLPWIQYIRLYTLDLITNTVPFRLPTMLPSIASRNQLTCSVLSRTMATQGILQMSKLTSGKQLLLQFLITWALILNQTPWLGSEAICWYFRQILT